MNCKNSRVVMPSGSSRTIYANNTDRKTLHAAPIKVGNNKDNKFLNDALLELWSRNRNNFWLAVRTPVKLPENRKRLIQTRYPRSGASAYEIKKYLQSTQSPGYDYHNDVNNIIARLRKMKTYDNKKITPNTARLIAYKIKQYLQSAYRNDVNNIIARFKKMKAHDNNKITHNTAHPRQMKTYDNNRNTNNNNLPQWLSNANKGLKVN